eukprot:228852_1
MAPTSWRIIRAICVSELLFMSAVIIYDFYRTKKLNQSNQTTDTNKITKWIRGYKRLTYLYIIFVYIHSFSLVLSQTTLYGITDSNGCWIKININAQLNQTVKSILYCLLITRLMASYANTTHQYSLRKVIIPFYIFIGLHYIYSIVVNFFIGNDTYPYDPNLINSCAYAPDDSEKGRIYVPMILMDIIMSIICLILFLRPLHKLLKNTA